MDRAAAIVSFDPLPEWPPANRTHLGAVGEPEGHRGYARELGGVFLESGVGRARGQHHHVPRHVHPQPLRQGRSQIVSERLFSTIFQGWGWGGGRGYALPGIKCQKGRKTH